MKFLVLLALVGSITCHLRDRAHQIYVGSALSPDHLNADAQYNTIAAQEFNCLTPENEMKWSNIEWSRGQQNYGPAEQLMAFAAQHQMKVRGHTLVWHAQVPQYLEQLDKTALEQALNNHIREEVTHFKGRIYAWDVVNEVIGDDGNPRLDSIWHKNFGTAYIAQAFRQAHEADPNAKLYINDFSIESKNQKSDGLYNLVKELLAQGVPVHGVGFQAHLEVGLVPHDFADNMRRFADLGLDVAITELDIRIKKPVTEQSRQQQARDYAQVFRDCLSVPRCVGITLWEFTDKYSWIHGWDQSFDEPCLWDGNNQPKNALISAVEAVLK